MGLGLFWGGRGCGRDSGLPGGLWWGQEQRGAPGLRLWPRPSDGLSPQNAPDEQRPVPGLAVEARAVPGSPHCSPAGLLQQVGSGGAPTPRPALWLVRGSRSRPDLSVDLSPRACRAGQGKRSQACHFTGQVPTAPCSPGLALPPWLSPGFGPPPQISRLFPAELSPHFGQGGQLSGPSPPPPSGVGLRLRVHGGPPPPPPAVCVCLPVGAHSPREARTRAWDVVQACSRTSLCPWPRVYLLYHTWSQVLYGGVAGSLMAIAWFAFTQEVLTPLFPRIASW